MRGVKCVHRGNLLSLGRISVVYFAELRGFRMIWIRRKKRVIVLSVVLLLVFAGCSTLSSYWVKKTDRLALRDLQTGILIGAEEKNLGDPQSPGAVLFVHGFVGCGNNFADLPERLEKRGWYVRVLRLPGHGTSPFDFENRSSEELMEAVKQEIQQLRAQHETLVVMGHSMGCALSVIAAAEIDVDRLVLGAPYFGVTYRWYYVLKPETWTTLLQPVLRWVYKGDLFVQVNRKEAKKEIVSYRWIPTQGIKALNRIGREANQDQILGNIHCPVLILHSWGDAAASFQSARKAFDRMASSDKKFVELHDSNHHIFWDYEQEQVMREIEEFVGFAP